MAQFPDAAEEIEAWTEIVEAVRWHNFAEVLSYFRDADYVGGYVIFNIRQNRYRLVTVVHYAKSSAEKKAPRPCVYSLVSDHQQYYNRQKWNKRFGNP